MKKKAPMKKASPAIKKASVTAKTSMSKTMSGAGRATAKPAAAAAPEALSRPKALPKPKNGLQFTQGEFIQAFQEYAMIATKRSAKEAYDGFVVMLQLSLKKGYKVALPGLGKLLVRSSKARQGRNPQTGAVINIPARKRIRFTPSKVLKDEVL